jgi:DNA repair protein RadD
MKSDRTYQQTARKQINRLLNSGRNPVLCMPTGTGKTYTACMIIKDRIAMGERVYILVTQIEIFNQWEIEFARMNIDYGTITADGIIGKNKGAYICMPLSLANILSKIPERFRVNGIITDEAHTGEARTYQIIYDYYPKAWRLGLTATPERTDGQGLDRTYDEIVEPITVKEAIKNGFLSEPLLIVPEQYALNVQINNGDYEPEQQAALLGDAKIIGDVLEQYSNIFAGMPCMIACSTFEHANQMTKAFSDAGWNFRHIHSDLNKTERAVLIRGIREGTLNGICTVGIGIAGLDIPGLFGLIWLRRTLSVTIYLQFIGRCLRVLNGKRYGIILDPVGNVFIHGAPDRERKWMLKGRREREKSESIIMPKMKICPICGIMNAEENINCHICNHDFRIEMPDNGKKRKIPAMVDGRFVVLDGEELGKRKEEIKEAIKEQRRQSAEREEKENTPIILSRQEKMTLLKTGLEKKGGLFQHAVKNYL